MFSSSQASRHATTYNTPATTPRQPLKQHIKLTGPLELHPRLTWVAESHEPLLRVAQLPVAIHGVGAGRRQRRRPLQVQAEQRTGLLDGRRLTPLWHVRRRGAWHHRSEVRAGRGRAPGQGRAGLARQDRAGLTKFVVLY